MEKLAARFRQADETGLSCQLMLDLYTHDLWPVHAWPLTCARISFMKSMNALSGFLMWGFLCPSESENWDLDEEEEEEEEELPEKEEEECEEGKDL